MYLYISFLRPPPVQAHPSKPLFITPQIANDLRTEPYDHEQDIYYSWVSSDQPIIHTVPLKLTTWRPSHAYKEIPLPAPPRVKPGQSWSLFLCSEKWTDEQPGVIDLASSCGSPFPVKSMPIFFTVNPTSRKQGNIERTYRLPSKAAGEYHRFTLREQTSFDLDKVCTGCHR